MRRRPRIFDSSGYKTSVTDIRYRSQAGSFKYSKGYISLSRSFSCFWFILQQEHSQKRKRLFSGFEAANNKDNITIIEQCSRQRLSSNFLFFPKYDKHQPRFTSTSTEVWPRTHRCKSKLQSSEPWSNFTEVDFVQPNGLMFVKYLLIVMQKKPQYTRVETRNHHISLIRSPERDRLKSQWIILVYLCFYLKKLL